MVETVRARSKELADNTALLRKVAVIETEKCKDVASTRQFLLDYVEKVVHIKNKVSLQGRVPIKHQTGDDVETNELAFCIESEITKEERYRDRIRASEAIRYQQSLALLREQSGTLQKSA